jgi:hypothetical protein
LPGQDTLTPIFLKTSSWKFLTDWESFTYAKQTLISSWEWNGEPLHTIVLITTCSIRGSLAGCQDKTHWPQYSSRHSVGNFSHTESHSPMQSRP